LLTRPADVLTIVILLAPESAFQIISYI
jgi:hypothetical protein